MAWSTEGGGIAALRAIDPAARAEERLASALARLASYEAAVAALAAVGQRLAGLSHAEDIVAAVPALALTLDPSAAVALLEVALDGAVRTLVRGGAPFEAPHWIDGEASALVRAAAAAVSGDGPRRAGGPGPRRSGRAVLLPVGRPAERRVLAVEPSGPDGAAALVEPLAILASLVASALDAARAATPRRGSAHRSSAPVARYTFDDLVGAAPAFLRVIDEARRAAASDLPVLVCGESGTGKELFAQAIHHASKRAAEPFVGINVAAIPHELLESELFGYEPGAFTGASAAGHPGKFEVAGAGTLLLDEIGEMPLDLQPKLLRVLQERLLQRVGGLRDVRVRARIVATSHRDLPEAVSTGRFRLDLFHRLCVIHLHVPPLRDRPGDVALVVDHRLRLHAERTGRRVRVAPALLDALAAYEWPGNVRELVNLVEGELGILPPGEDVLSRVPEVLFHARAPAGDAAPPRLLSLSELERRACAETLARFDGNVARAAAALGVPKRTLYAKMKRWGLQAPKAPPAPHVNGANGRCPPGG